jgi:hypothetical protein
VGTRGKERKGKERKGKEKETVVQLGYWPINDNNQTQHYTCLKIPDDDCAGEV